MTFRVVIALASATLIAAPTPERANTVRDLAGRVGQILGAASACRDISRARIKAISDKMGEVIRGAAATEDERLSMVGIFDRNVADGLKAMSTRQAECPTAERNLADLERVVVTPVPAPPVAAVVPQALAPAIGAVAPGLAPAVALTPAPTLPPAAPPIVTTPPALASATTQGQVRGVTDKEIRFGMAAPFSGSARELGRQMKLGIETVFNVINSGGGIYGRQLRLVTVDDGYEPTRTGDAMRQLSDKEEVFGVIGNVGTPTAEVAVPYALEHRMLFFGGFTGAGLLRRDPPDRYVFNYRASYAEETDVVVRYLVKVRQLRPDQIAVFAQQDGYGDAGYAGVTKAMRSLGVVGQTLRLDYKRNTVDVDEAVARLRGRRNQIKAVVMVATYRAAAKFIEKTRDLYPALIYTNVSFVGSTALAEELKLLGPRFANGVIVTQVVPAVDSYSTIILEYKTALGTYFPGEAPDYVSLEGYVAARVLVEALKRAGPQLDTEKLVETLESLHDYDMGLGTLIGFGRTEHQASHKVWGTMLDATGHFQAIDLQ